mgnify:CR=1 FL=1
MDAKKVLEDLQRRFPNEPEYHQAVEEVLGTIEEEYNKHPEFDKVNLIERLCIPDRIYTFRVTWMDDKGNFQTNTGYRIQHNNAIGPYKGGIRFHKSVNLGILKFLAFEQTFKNSLTTLPMGGAKGGSDFSPRGKSSAEVMRFCQAFMLELYRHIGPDCDVPAGDIGVGGREVGYMFGAYKKYTRQFQGVLTGKGIEFGGSLIRPEATGYGVVYFAAEMLATQGQDFKGKTVMTGGPHLQLLRSGLSTGEYWPQSTKVSIEGSEAVIDMDVIYSPIAAAYQIRIDNNGLMTVHYTIKRIPDPAPRSFTIPWSSADMGGYSEVGLVFTLPSSVDRLTWDRKGLWTTYPENHVGRNHGIAWKSPEGLDDKEWKNLTYDFNWMGGSLARSTVPNDFRASKEYFSKADVLLKDTTIGIEALSEEKDAIRLAVSPRGGDVSMFINNLWNYPTLGVGNYMKPAVIVNEGYSNTVYLRLIDTDN